LKIHLCFVCLGNICRSPTAEAIMLNLVEESGLEEHIEIDSAGTSSYHVGEEADPRSQACAIEHGLSLDTRSQQFEADDFDQFDYVLAMDAENRDILISLAPTHDDGERVFMLRAFDPKVRDESDVPDPYHGGDNGFDDVFEICQKACEGLLAHLIENHGLPG
jgi:protein-tyrosine phosphatase